MPQRNLLYAGVTRGKRLVVLVGPKKAVAIRSATLRAGAAGRSSAVRTAIASKIQARSQFPR
jgi:exodeoxyribonuclease V alpha subunit